MRRLAIGFAASLFSCLPAPDVCPPSGCNAPDGSAVDATIGRDGASRDRDAAFGVDAAADAQVGDGDARIDADASADAAVPQDTGWIALWTDPPDGGGGSNPEPVDLAVSSAGVVVTAVNYDAPLLLPSGVVLPADEHDAVIEALTSTGGERWRLPIDGPNSQDATTLSIDGAGRLAAGGRYKGGFRFAGARRDNDLDASYSGWAALLSPTRAPLAFVRWGSGGDQQAIGALANANRFFIVGTLAQAATLEVLNSGLWVGMVPLGDGPAFIAAVGMGVALPWAQSLSGGPLEPRAVVLDPTGAALFVGGTFSNTILLGALNATASMGTDSFLISIRADGSGQHLAAIHGNNDELLTALVVEGSRIWALGSFGTTIDVDGTVLANGGLQIIGIAFRLGDLTLDTSAPRLTASVPVTIVDAAERNGRLVIFGAAENTVDFGNGVVIERGMASPSMFAVSWQNSTAQRVRSWDGNGQVSPRSVALDPNNGDLLIHGLFSDTISFMMGPLTSSGNSVFVERSGGL